MCIKKDFFSCDVDGIMNDYPLCWLRYLADKCGTLYETVNLAKDGEKNYRQYKDEYRNSSYKANLPVHRSNRDVINSIIAKGFEPVMVTSRPINDNNYPLLYNNTISWLKRNNIIFKFFDFKDPNALFLEKYPRIKFHIDDDPAYAIKVAYKGVKVYLLKNENWDFSILLNTECPHLIKVINNLDEILRYESLF